MRIPLYVFQLIILFVNDFVTRTLISNSCSNKLIILGLDRSWTTRDRLHRSLAQIWAVRARGPKPNILNRFAGSNKLFCVGPLGRPRGSKRFDKFYHSHAVLGRS